MDYYDVFDTSKGLGLASVSFIKGRPQATVLMGWREGHWEPITPKAAREYVRAGKLRFEDYEDYEWETRDYSGDSVTKSYCLLNESRFEE